MGFFATIADKVRRNPSLEERVNRAVFHLKQQSERLEQIKLETEKLAQDTFEKCVNAQEERDPVKSRIYAEECVQARKVHQMVLASQLSLEQTILRLQTLKEFQGMVDEVKPITKVASSLKGKLSHLAPSLALELKGVDDTLTGMLIEARASEISERPKIVPNEVERILEEASTIAEERAKQKFPTVVGESIGSK